MVSKEISKRAALVGMVIGLMASPLAIAQSSIELNQDRSAGHGIIDTPDSHTASPSAHDAAGELNRHEGDSLDFKPSSRRASSSEKETKTRQEGYRPEELNRDEGDSTDW